MSRQSFALLAVRAGAAEYVNDYIAHPDFRLVAAFFLGWVFFSGLRHVWFSAFFRELMWTCKAISDRLRGRIEEPVNFTGSLHDKSVRIHRSLYQHKQRGAPVLLLCMAFMLASLSSFLSLLTFYPMAGQTSCTFVIAATAVASQVARMFGFLILGLDLSHCVGRPWELRTFWLLLGIGTVLSGVTAVIGTGQLITSLAVPTVALCIRKRFLPTSVVSSSLNVVLELYIIIRSLSLTQPPRLRLSIVQHARIVQAGSLLLFDLLVVVPNTIYTNIVADFVPYSIGALGVLAAFNSSFSHDDPVEFVPTWLDVHSSRPHIDNPISVIAGPNPDVEVHASPSPSPSHSPREIRRHPMTPLDGQYDGTLSTPSPQPYEASSQTAMNIVPSGAQPEPGNLPRREKIVSYSNPFWATFGAPRNEKSSSHASTDSELSIDVTRSSTSNDHSHERSTKLLSGTSTILGSDIIRRTTSNKGKDRMRIRYSIPDLPLSTTSVPSSKWAMHHSWLSRMPPHPITSEDTSQQGSTLPKGGVVSSRPTSLVSSRLKPGSKSSQSSKSRKSSSSTRSARTTVFKSAEDSPSMPVWIGSSMGPVTPARPPASLPRDRVGLVRGPRPLPSQLRTQDDLGRLSVRSTPI